MIIIGLSPPQTHPVLTGMRMSVSCTVKPRCVGSLYTVRWAGSGEGFCTIKTALRATPGSTHPKVTKGGREKCVRDRRGVSSDPEMSASLPGGDILIIVYRAPYTVYALHAATIVPLPNITSPTIQTHSAT